jgi:hypothetical protein
MVLRPLSPSYNPIDTVVEKYNTFLCWESSVIGVGNPTPSDYVEFNHNTMVYNFTFPFKTNVQYVTHKKIENNIFYGVYAGGMLYTKYHNYYFQHTFNPVSCIEADTLGLANAKLADPADSTNPNVDSLAELKRIAVVCNNAYFQPEALTNFWTAWDDTAHVDTLITPLWMNPETVNMFNDKIHWPGYQESHNLVGVDPGFGPSFQSVLQPTTGGPIVSLLQFITEVWTNTIKTDEWGYQKQQVTGSNWIPQWPLPETADMQYTNATVKNNSNDGKPLGDPRWFNGGRPTGVEEMPAQVVEKFSLSDNYPNPFNPSTTIKVSLSHSGVMSLKVYNVLGQLVKVVDEGYKPAGEYVYEVNMDNFGSGVYFYTLQQGNNMITKKMILLK